MNTCTASPTLSDDDASDFDDNNFDGFEEIGLADTASHVFQYYDEDDSNVENAGGLFVHKPLCLKHDIRLLQLLPSREHDAEIRCRIIHASLTDCDAAYEALSYTWGSPIEVETIKCNGGSTLIVTKNCVDAMRDLRHPVHERILWIDAICIDQSNVRERNRQVALMASIYSKAKRVIIYTGKEYSPIQKYLEVLRTGNAEYITTNSSPDWFQSLVSTFLSRPWFSRVWVLQEIVMAREALILFPGGETLGWNYLSIASLNTLGITAVQFPARVPPVLQLSQADKKPLKDIISLMNVAGECQSSDPRDKIYALLGLLKDTNELGLTVDYERSVEELYQEIAVLVIKVYNHLDVLSYCLAHWFDRTTDGEQDKDSGDHPSWVPDLNRLPYQTSFVRWRGKASVVYDERPVAMFHPNHSLPGSLTLRLQLLPLDRLDVVELEPGESWPSGTSFWNGVDFKMVREPQESTIVAHAKTIRTALYSGSYEEAVQLKANSRFYDMSTHIGEYESDRWWRGHDLSPLSLPFYGHRPDALTKFAHRRRFAPTQRSFAICPKAMSKKDIVCAVRGASVPLLLRKTSSGRFWLIGECYIHGFKSSAFTDDYHELLGAYRRYFERPQSWEMPEFADMGTIDADGNLPWVEVSLV